MIPSINGKPFPDSFPQSPAASSYRERRTLRLFKESWTLDLSGTDARGAEMALWASR